MSFKATRFIYDGTPSEKFDLFLCNIDKTGTDSQSGGADITVHTSKTSSMDFNYLMGIEYDQAFEFTFTFSSTEKKDRFDVSVINNWLIGKQEYKKLQIIQDDMSNIYFNCILKDFRVISFGNEPLAFECTAVCDRGWAMEEDKTYTYRINASPQIIMHNNASHKSNITLPLIEFKTNRDNATVSIRNEGNNGWETKITGLSNKEVISMDSQLELIESSMNLNRLHLFNKHWFELIPNMNKVIVTGDIEYLKITYANVRKVGC